MSTDLSEVHQPVSDLFARTEADHGSCELSPEQVASFHENGFLTDVPILNNEQLDVLRAELTEFFDPDHQGRELWHYYCANESNDNASVLFHALGAWRLRPAMHDILWSPAFTRPAGQLLEGPVRFWHDQLFCKPAGHGGVVAWHQDYSYWTRTIPMQHLTCWIGLDDSTLDNGCIHYVQGSHRWPLLPMTDLGNDMEAIRTVLSEGQLEQFKPVPCELKAGHASFHHPLTLHGSYENRSPKPRRAIVLNVCLDGTLSDQDEPLLENSDPVPKGQPLNGRFYPLLTPVKPAN